MEPSPVTSLLAWRSRLALFSFALLSSSLGLMSLSIVHAATFAVDRTDDESSATTCDDATPNDCSLRGAIIKANSTSGADIINVPAGTYTLTIPGPSFEDASADGDLDIRGDLTITGAGAATTIIQACTVDQKTAPCPLGQGITDNSVFALPPVFPRARVEIVGITIQNGRFTGGSGGGIENLGDTLIVTDSVIKNNTATLGGGISAIGTLTLTNSVIRDNVATTSDGGGVNFAPGNDSTGNPGTLNLLSSSVSANTSGRNGGGISGAGTMTLTNSTVSGNSAGVSASGGGIFGVLGSSTLTLRNSTIDTNTAGSGGGVSFEGVATFRNSTLSGNTAARCGGAQLFGFPNDINNVTITANQATSVGGGLCGTGNVRNTIIAGNLDFAAPNAPDCGGSFTSGGFNLIGNGSGCNGFAAVRNDIVGTVALPVNPVLGSLLSNGGPTRTHALLPGSPAIDAGNPATPGSGNATCEQADQRGDRRREDGNRDGIPICDAGAFEFPERSDLSASGIRPNHAGNTSPLLALIYGRGFQSGLTVKLVCGNSPAIEGNPVKVEKDGAVIATTFDLTGKAPGSCAVVVTNPGAPALTLAEPFTIEVGGTSQL